MKIAKNPALSLDGECSATLLANQIAKLIMKLFY